MSFLLILGVFIVLTLARLYCIQCPSKNLRRTKKSPESRKLAVFLGSGGHTTEMLTLISSLDFQKYSPRIYIISEGDNLSKQKAVALEATKADKSNLKSSYSILVIPRARKVHQPLITVPPTALFSLLRCVYHVTLEPLVHHHRISHPYFADLLVLNGPGTCLILCLAVTLNKFLGLPAPTTFYVESFARVNTLSVSGNILRFLVDRFIVQWPQLLKDTPKAEYRGWFI